MSIDKFIKNIKQVDQESIIKLKEHYTLCDKNAFEENSEKDLIDLPISILIKMQKHIEKVILFKTSLEMYGQLKRYKSNDVILIKDENITINVSRTYGRIILFNINEHKFSVLNTGKYGSIYMEGQDDIMSVKYSITLDNIIIVLKDWYKIRKDAKVNIIDERI